MPARTSSKSTAAKKRQAKLQEEFVAEASEQNRRATVASKPSDDLFVEDSAGRSADVLAAENATKKVSRKIWEPQTELRRKLEARAKELNEKKANPPKPAPAAGGLKDIWASGEAGLPPLTAYAQSLVRNGGAAKLTEWNIDVVPRTSLRKTRAIHAQPSIKQTSIPKILVPLPGTSYNPTAAAHVDAMVELGDAHRVRRERNTAKNDVVNPVNLKEITIRNSGEEEEESDPEEDAQETTREEKPKSETSHLPKSKTQRAHEARMKALKRESEQAKLDRLAERELERAANIAREADKALARKEKELAERQQREAERAATKWPVRRVNGKIAEGDSDPFPEVLAPSQLPKTLRELPGVPGLLETQFAHMHRRNLMELGSKKRTPKRRLKGRDQLRGFDLDVHAATRIVEPRFKRVKQSKAA